MCSCSCTAATPAGTNACNLHLYVFLQAKDQAKTSMRKADDKAFTRVMQERVDHAAAFILSIAAICHCRLLHELRYREGHE
jgi:hypothetical protein